MRNTIIALTGLFLLLGSDPLMGQVLQEKVSINVRDATIKSVLLQLESRSNARFSYSDDVVPVNRKITLHLRQVVLAEALNQILANTFIDYRANGNQVMLFRKQLQLDRTKEYAIRGFVRESGSGEPLFGVNVFIPGTGRGTATNAYGYYSLSLPSDTFRLRFSYIGYESKEEFILLDQDIELNVNLQSGSLLAEVVVDGRPVEPISELNNLGKVEISVSNIFDIPQLFGEKDALKVMKLLPGVLSGNEAQAGLYVRGGGNDQNLVILDGATIYNASHFFGLFSLFNGDALRSVELTKGAFPARYGGRLSSVMEIHMKDGNKQEFHGSAGMGLISSRLTLEGPIRKNVSSFLITGRRTYLFDLILNPLLARDQDLGMYFYDVTAKADWIFSDRDKLILSMYTGRDRLYYNEAYNSSVSKVRNSWENVSGTLRWNHVYGKRIFSNTSFLLSDYTLSIDGENSYNQNTYLLSLKSGIRDFSVKSDFDYDAGKGHTLHFGAVATYHLFRPQAFYKRNDFVNQEVRGGEVYHSGEGALYIEDNFRLTENWRLHSGLRLANFYARGKNYFRPEPRISLFYSPDKRQTYKASFSVMNQFIHMLTNTSIGLPTNLWVPSTRIIGPEQALHYNLGYAFHYLKLGLLFSVEGYYKQSSGVVGFKEGSTFVEASPTGDPLRINWEQNIAQGRGTSYGAEILIRKNLGKLSGWMGYTLSWSWLQFDEINQGERFFARYDRRHDISLVGIYHLSKRITLSSSWVYGTGNAVTLPLAQYYAGSHEPSVIQSGGFPGFLVNEYSMKNQYRMSPYHRLDLAVQFHREREKWARTLEVGLYNAYNRKNPYFYYISTDTRTLKKVSLLPLLPSISYSVRF